MMPAVIFAVLVAVYEFLATAGTWQFRDTASAYFDALGESFLHGHLYLPDTVPPALLALPNPYDPAQRSAIAASWPWDSSLFNGHLYLYWGPAAAIVHAIWHLRVRTPLFESEFGVWVALANCLVFWLLLAHLRRRAFPTTSGFLVWGSVLAFGLGGMTPFMVGRPSVYHSPILLATLGLLAALYCLAIASDSSAWRGRYLFLTGALLGWAIASRISYAAYAVGVGLLLTVALVKTRATPGRAVRDLGAFSAPIVLTVFALFGYNWVRFGSPFESGQRYQLAGTDQTQTTPTCGTNMLGYLGLYFLAMPRLQATYPFVAVDIGPSLVFPDVMPTVFPPAPLTQMIPQEPPVVSAFLLVPIGLLVFSAPLIRWRGPALVGAAAVLSASVVGIIATTGALSCAGGVDARYYADLTPALSVAGAVLLLAWSQRLNDARGSTAGRARALLPVFAATAWAISIAIGLLLGTTAWSYWAPEAIQHVLGVTVP